MNPNTEWNKHLRLGKNVIIGKYVILGERPPKENDFLEIGDDSIIRSHTVIYWGNKIGRRFRTGHGVLIRENNVIGDNVSIGSHTIVERNNVIGNNVRIHSNCFIPEFVIIEDDVWIGPSTVILNVLHPPCPAFEECAKHVIIKRGAKIGGHVTIGPRVTIGSYALIGMGSVVTKDVPDGAVAYGNPARVIKRVDELKCELGIFDRPYSWERV